MGTRILMLGGAMAGVVALASAGVGQEAAAEKFMGMPLLFADDFESAALDGWQASDPGAWRVVLEGENHVLDQYRQSEVETPVRSPFNRAIAIAPVVGDFVLDARVQSTTRDYPHRDVCLFFGYQDPAHMYYVHLGKQADDHANSIFLVNGSPRVSIAEKRTTGTDWDDDWHRVRIVRKVEEGSIAVYFDDMQKPVMTAVDKHFTWGRVGVGTFDDTGRFDDVRLWGLAAEPSK